MQTKIDFNFFKIRDTVFLPYTDKSTFKGLFFYDLIDEKESKALKQLQLTPSILDFKER